MESGGETELQFDNKFVRVLHAGVQRGKLMVWVLLQVTEGDNPLSSRIIIVNDTDETVDGAEYFGVVKHNDKEFHVFIK